MHTWYRYLEDCLRNQSWIDGGVGREDHRDREIVGVGRDRRRDRVECGEIVPLIEPRTRMIEHPLDLHVMITDEVHDDFVQPVLPGVEALRRKNDHTMVKRNLTTGFQHTASLLITRVLTDN